ncbi:hypothetical protein L0Y59_03875 [Candidatus Uhrbacteria bacterium]|nr:hypothetical protein [Candidatus Uhrbacteria bacterium]
MRHTSFVLVSILVAFGCNSEPEADVPGQTSTTTVAGGSGGSTPEGGTGGSGGDAGSGGVATGGSSVGGAGGSGGTAGAGGESCQDAEGTVRFRWTEPDGYDLSGGAIRVCGEYLLPGDDPVNHWDCTGTDPDVSGFCQMLPSGIDGTYECTADIPAAATVTYNVYVGGVPAAYAFDECAWAGDGAPFGTSEVLHLCLPLEIATLDNGVDGYDCTKNGRFSVPGEL